MTFMWWLPELGDLGFIFNIIDIVTMFHIRPELWTQKEDINTRLRSNAHFNSENLKRCMRLTQRRNPYWVTRLGQRIISLWSPKVFSQQTDKNQTGKRQTCLLMCKGMGISALEKHLKSVVTHQTRIIHELTYPHFFFYWGSKLWGTQAFLRASVKERRLVVAFYVDIHLTITSANLYLGGVWNPNTSGQISPKPKGGYWTRKALFAPAPLFLKLTRHIDVNFFSWRDSFSESLCLQKSILTLNNQL